MGVTFKFRMDEDMIIDVGHLCDAEHCGVKDFLPFHCDACGQSFCLEHRTPASHGCHAPAAGRASSAAADQRAAVKKVKPKKRRMQRCRHAGCRNKAMVMITCGDCGLPFCASHRFADQHSCRGFMGEDAAPDEGGAPGLCEDSAVGTESLRALLSMGFDGARAARCLEETGGNLAEAVAILVR